MTTDFLLRSVSDDGRAHDIQRLRGREGLRDATSGLVPLEAMVSVLPRHDPKKQSVSGAFALPTDSSGGVASSWLTTGSHDQGHGGPLGRSGGCC